jgi:hypothetical protein
MSSKEIDYRLRPAKHVERKMIVRALGRLSHFDRLEQYAYVGFGALYFSDFRLFHELGIEDMTSIEKRTNIKRYETNKPYGTVKINQGAASAVLPKLPWDKRTITWLDYTGFLDPEKLEDIRFAADRAQSGSALIATVAVRLDGTLEELVSNFIAKIGGKESLPQGVVPEAIQLSTPEKVAHWVRGAINQRIEAALREKNAGKQIDDCYRYEQLFNFHYADGAEMLTVGGVIFQEKEREKFRTAEFDSLPFVKNGEDEYRIPTPLLTHRETIALDAELPAPAKTLALPGVPEKDIAGYAKVYRYFPKFVDANF